MPRLKHVISMVIVAARRSKLVGVFALAAALSCGPALAQIEPLAPPSSPPPGKVVESIARRAVDVGSEVSRPGPAEAAAIGRLVKGARVIAFGEIGHGKHEPLAYRNRLIRHLAEQEGLTAVALESGLAESRQLYDYVLGGDGDPKALLSTGLTHGFGRLRENLELVEWLRAYNARSGVRPVRLYGIDRSTIQSAPPGVSGYGVVLDHVVAYLARTVPEPSRDLRARLNGFARRFTEVDYPSYTPAEREALDAALAETERLFARERQAMIRASSKDDYEWAAREAHDAARLPQLFAVWSNDPFETEKLIRMIELRDQAMAEHTEWVLEREGPQGKVLLFQTNGHIAAAPLIGSVMRNFPRQPKLTGIWLRERLGRGYRPIASVSNFGRPASDASLGSVDRAFAAAGRAPVLLDLRDGRAGAWWSRPQAASQGDKRVDDFTPTEAFDAMLYLDRLTPVVPLEPRPAS